MLKTILPLFPLYGGMVDIETIKAVAKTFGGVEHRAEFVREYNGVKYYNDSIASSPTRTALGTLSLYDEKNHHYCRRLRQAYSL